MTSVLMGDRKEKTHRHRGEGPVKTKAEAAMMGLQAKECQGFLASQNLGEYLEWTFFFPKVIAYFYLFSDFYFFSLQLVFSGLSILYYTAK